VLSINKDGIVEWASFYTKEEVDSVIKKSSKIKRKIMSSLDDIYSFIENNEDADSYIFMVSSGDDKTPNKYKEYIIVYITDENGNEVKQVEQIGSDSFNGNLEDYLIIQEANKLLEAKVDK
jgi:hypothetical protein